MAQSFLGHMMYTGELIIGSYNALEDHGLGSCTFDILGQEIAPFFYLPAGQHYEIPEHLRNESFLMNPEILLPGCDTNDFSIPNEVKDVVSVLGLVSSVVLIPNMWIGLAIAAGIAGVSNIIRIFAEPDSMEYHISEFLLKINKVIFFCTSAIAVGGTLTAILGSGMAASIVGSGIASILNSMYNIIEEDIEYSLFPLPEGTTPTTGIDKHSCVNYEDGSLMVNCLASKVINKMVGRTSKEFVKTLLQIALDDILNFDEPLIGAPISLMANFLSNITETVINSGVDNMGHHAKRDFIAAFTKTFTKVGLEQIHKFTGMLSGHYLISALSVFSAVLARTLYDGYWDAYLPECFVRVHPALYEDLEDFENES